IAVRGSIHKSPKLAFARCDFNLGSYRAVHGHDLLWRLWLGTTNIRTEINALFQFGRLWIAKNGTAPHNHGAFPQASQGRKIRFDALDHDRSGHAVKGLPVALSMGMRMIPIQARGMVFRNLHV